MAANAPSSGASAGVTSGHSGARQSALPVTRRMTASSVCSAAARIVAEGFTPVDAGRVDPSTTCRPGSRAPRRPRRRRRSRDRRRPGRRRGGARSPAAAAPSTGPTPGPGRPGGAPPRDRPCPARGRAVPGTGCATAAVRCPGGRARAHPTRGRVLVGRTLREVRGTTGTVQHDVAQEGTAADAHGTCQPHRGLTRRTQRSRVSRCDSCSPAIS